MLKGVSGLARSAVAAVVAAAVLGAAALPAVTHQRAGAAEECQGHPADAPEVPAQDSGGCDHLPGSSCATMLGCITTAPALGAALALVTFGPVVPAIGPSSSLTVLGRLALGPPPPPPNN